MYPVFISVIETQIPTEEDLIDEGSVRFPPPAGDENAVRFSNLTPTVEIPADLVIQRIAMEGRLHIRSYTATTYYYIGFVYTCVCVLVSS